MQPRIRKPNAGRPFAFLRKAGPPLRLPGSDAGSDAGAADRPPEAGDASLGALRRQVARLEGRLAADARLEDRTEGGGCARLTLGVPAFDELFAGGGAALGSLIDLRAAESREAGAITGFVAALAVRIGVLRPGPLLWVREARVAREAGRPAGVGLAQLGFDPARLLVVEVRDAAEALWAVEEGLGCRGLSAVVGEVQGRPRALDLTASRRLALRARSSQVPALMVGHGAEAEVSAAAARLRVEARRSVPAEGFTGGPGFPAFRITVEKNRDGRTGLADMEWSPDERRFRPLPALPQPVAAPDPDGPLRPPAPGTVLAYPARRAS